MRGQSTLFASARDTEGGSRDDWRTPAHVIDVVREIFGGQIDLDPCADGEPDNWVATANYSGPPHWQTKHKRPTGEIYYLDHYGNGIDGLKQRWDGNVFVNPPYSAIRAWCAKAAQEDKHVNTTQTIMLIPARTETQAWQTIATRASAICLVRGRLNFVGGKHSATFPSALIYMGGEPEQFADIADQLGGVWHPAPLPYGAPCR